MKNISRRSFLGATVAAGAAAISTPVSAASTSCEKIPAKWDKEYDVVVLGCGGSGLMAALQAHDAGGTVGVYDAGKSPYHTATSMCGGLYAAWGSKMQKADPEGSKDTWEQFAHDIMDYGAYMNLKEPVNAYAQNSGKAFDFLESCGLPPHHLEPYAGHTYLRAHRQDSFKGRDYIDTLVPQLEKRGIAINHKMPLERIWFDPQTNTVLGVQVGKGDAAQNVKANKAVILCTGGFTGTPESLDAWVPNVAGKGVSIGGNMNDGTAMRIAVRDVGVPLSHMQYIASYPCGIVINGRNGPYLRWWFITDNGGILINKNGERFISEKEGSCHVTPHLAFQPEGCHYVLADQAAWDRTLSKFKLGSLVSLPSWPEARIEKEFKLGKNFWKCDTIEELCDRSGIKLDGLKKQLDTWNKAVDTKTDTQYGRTDQQWKLETGPWYMVRMEPWNNLSCGGVRVNEDMQVLGWDLKPVNHFYAAGEGVAGVHGAYYCGGNACGFAHTSGWIAGRRAMGKEL